MISTIFFLAEGVIYIDVKYDITLGKIAWGNGDVITPQHLKTYPYHNQLPLRSGKECGSLYYNFYIRLIETLAVACDKITNITEVVGVSCQGKNCLKL